MAAPGRRAAARIAWRQARRAPWRTTLIVATIAIPVALLSMGLVFIASGIPTPAERTTQRMGTADVSVEDWFGDIPTRRQLARFERGLPEGSAVGYREATWIRLPAREQLLNVAIEQWSVPVDQRPIRGLYRLIEGRLPANPHEAAIHPDALESLGAEIGETLRLPVSPPPEAKDRTRIELHLTITGLVELPRVLDQPMVIAGWGALDGTDAAISQVLIDLPDGVDASRAVDAGLGLPPGSSVALRQDATIGDERAQLVASAAAVGGSALALFGTGLVAAAAFVLGARRQLRALGLIAASGAEPAQVRRVVTMGGLVLGSLGSLLGVALGVALAVTFAPTAERIANERFGELLVPWAWLAVAATLGTLAAVLAAYGPARSAASVSPTEALAGRGRTPKPPGRLARRGVVVAVLGLAGTGAATATRSIPGIAAGLIVTVCGFLLAIPLVASWAGRAAAWLPASARLAARDASRHGRRTGAALAAATMVLALPVAVSALTLSQETGATRDVPPLEDDMLALGFSPITEDPDGERAEFLRIVGDAIPGALIVELVPAAYPPGSPHNPEKAGPRDVWVQGAQQPSSAGPGSAGYSELALGPLWVGGPETLRALHAEDGIDDLQAGVVVGIGPGGAGPAGMVRPLDASGLPLEETYAAVDAGRSQYGNIGFGGTTWNFVISEEAARGHGLVPDRNPAMGRTWILRAPARIGTDTIEQIRLAAALDTGGYLTASADFFNPATTMRLAVTATAAGIAVVIVWVVIALVGAESRRDQAILVAVGAGPWMRRKVAATNAWLLATLGGVLAVPAGFAPVIVIQLARRTGLDIVVPWTAIGVALVGLPVLAGLFAAATSRRPAAAQMLRPIS